MNLTELVVLLRNMTYQEPDMRVFMIPFLVVIIIAEDWDDNGSSGDCKLNR
jgi:hypothetical protein